MASKINIPVIIILFIVIFPGLACAGQDDLPSQFLAFHVQGDQDKSWLEKGRILYSRMAYREAIEAFAKIDRKAPADIMDESLYLSANSLMETGMYEEAESFARSIPEKSPFQPFALYTRAMINLRTGREKIAADHLKDIAKYARASQPSKGEVLSKKVIGTGDIEKLTHRANLTLGFLFLENNDYDEALKHFSAVPKKSPFYDKALFGLGWTYARMDRWVRSVVVWEELFTSYPDSPYTLEVVPYIGNSYTRLSAYGKAAEQNGAAIRYYSEQIARISGLRSSLKRGDFNSIAAAAKILGDNQLNSGINSYMGLLKMEEYIGKHGTDMSPEGESLIKSSIQSREDLLDDIFEKVQTRIGLLLKQLLDASVDTTVIMAQNLRLEGGGQISNEMIFINHD